MARGLILNNDAYPQPHLTADVVLQGEGSVMGVPASADY